MPLVLLVVPLFNADGNDALDPRNRRLDLKKLTGQPGPVVGTRTQSQGINLNRDYLRQAAPEMRLLQQRVCIPWAPDLDDRQPRDQRLGAPVPDDRRRAAHRRVRPPPSRSRWCASGWSPT